MFTRPHILASGREENYSKGFNFQKPGENPQFCSPQHVQVLQRHVSISFQQKFFDVQGEKKQKKDHHSYSEFELEPHINKGFLLNLIESGFVLNDLLC